MELSRSGYYKWLKRKGTLNRYQSDKILLCNVIKEYHNKHKSWGYRHIAAEIRKDTGWIFSNNLCHKSCKNHIKALKNLIKTKIKRGYKDLETIVHSDQGIMYSSMVFANTHKDYNESSGKSYI